MIKNVFTILYILAYDNSGAQISLTESDFVPIIGEVHKQYLADTSIVEGGNGANQTWIYNNLFISTDSLIKNHVTVASTPYASYYPSATFASSYNGGNYEYFSATSNSYIVHGGMINPPNVQGLVYSLPVMSYTFPFTYGSNTSNTNVAGNLYYLGNLAGTFSGSTSTMGDAYGDLIINGNVFENVLRIKKIFDTNFSTPLGVIHTVISSYLWYDGVHKFPILEITTDDDTGAINAHDKKVYVPNLSIVLGIKTYKESLFSVYPNPCHSKLIFNLKSTPENIEIKLVSSYGQIVQQQKLLNGDNIIDISNNPKGIYFLEVKNGTKYVYSRIIKL